jgi:hypothetical protein
MADDKASAVEGDASRRIISLPDSSHSPPLPSPFPLHPSQTTPSRHPPYSPPISPSPTALVSLHMTEPSHTASGTLSLHEYRKYLSGPLLDVAADPSPRRTLKRKAKALNLNSTRSAFVLPSPPPSPISSSHPFSLPLSPQFSQSLDFAASEEQSPGPSRFSPELTNFTSSSAEERLLPPPSVASQPQRSIITPGLVTARCSPHGKRLVSLFFISQ